MAKNNAQINTKGGKGSYSQGVFVPKNPEKCISPNENIWRSGWEKDFMVVCDENPSIIQWGVEPFFIPYTHPFTNTTKSYWPDFIIVYIDKATKSQKVDLIEIKPMNESVMEFAKSKRNQQAMVINHAKWEAAYGFCKQNNMNFRIMTEVELYGSKGKR